MESTHDLHPVESVINEAASSGFGMSLEINRATNGDISFDVTHGSKYEGVSHIEHFDLDLGDGDYAIEPLLEVLEYFLKVSLVSSPPE